MAFGGIRAPVTPIIHHDNINFRVDVTCFKKFCVVCYRGKFNKFLNSHCSF